MWVDLLSLKKITNHLIEQDPSKLRFWAPQITEVLKHAYYNSVTGIGVKDSDFRRRVSGTTLALASVHLWIGLKRLETGHEDQKVTLKTLNGQGTVPHLLK